MKTLYIVRHAKSSWDNPALADHDRPLNKTGIKKTRRIISFLQSKNTHPDLLISSSALRAKTTAELIAEGLKYPLNKIQIDESLYHATSDTIYSLLFGLSDDINTVMVFGHNPTLTFFVNHYVEPQINNLPTTGIVSIEFGIDQWEKIIGAQYRLNFVVFPRMLK